jgi:hypothetical protein
MGEWIVDSVCGMNRNGGGFNPVTMTALRGVSSLSVGVTRCCMHPIPRRLGEVCAHGVLLPDALQCNSDMGHEASRHARCW